MRIRLSAFLFFAVLFGTVPAWAEGPVIEKVPFTAHNVGMADCDVAAVSGNIIAISMDEHEQSADLNGDGDTQDRVLGYYDVNAKALTNTGLGIGNSVSIDGDIIAFELAEGDYYWDAKRTLGYYSISRRKAHDTKIVMSEFGRHYRGPTRVVSGGRIAYTVMERDLNGDGRVDSEICMFDIEKNRSERLGAIGFDPSFQGDTIAYVVPHPSEDWPYWNNTIGYYDLRKGEAHDTGMAGGSPIIDKGIIVFASPDFGMTWLDTRRWGWSWSWWWGRGYSWDSVPVPDWSRDAFSIKNGVISLLVDEWGFADLNGDGDTDDYEMVMLYNIEERRLINTGVQGCCGTDISEKAVVFDTYEGDRNVQTDLNGDGDLNDCVQRYILLSDLVTVPEGMETVPMEAINLAVQDCNEAAASDKIIAMAREDSTLKKDYKKAPNTWYSILVYYDLEKKTTVDTHIPIEWKVATDGNVIAFLIPHRTPEAWYPSTLGYYVVKTNKLVDTGIVVGGFGSGTAATRAVSGGRIAYTLGDGGWPGQEICYYDTKTGVQTRTGVRGVNPTISGDVISYSYFIPSDPESGWRWGGEWKIGYYDIGAGQAHETGLSGHSPIVDNGLIAYDTWDGIRVYNITTGTDSATGLADWSRGFSISNGVIAALVNEYNFGDLNGDGDTRDNDMLVIYDTNTGRLINTAVRGCCGPDICNGIITFDTYEDDIRTDLNGDGDWNDCVQRYVDLRALPVRK